MAPNFRPRGRCCDLLTRGGRHAGELAGKNLIFRVGADDPRLGIESDRFAAVKNDQARSRCVFGVEATAKTLRAKAVDAPVHHGIADIVDDQHRVLFGNTIYAAPFAPACPACRGLLLGGQEEVWPGYVEVIDRVQRVEAE